MWQLEVDRRRRARPGLRLLPVFGPPVQQSRRIHRVVVAVQRMEMLVRVIESLAASNSGARAVETANAENKGAAGPAIDQFQTTYGPKGV